MRRNMKSVGVGFIFGIALIFIMFATAIHYEKTEEIDIKEGLDTPGDYYNGTVISSVSNAELEVSYDRYPELEVSSADKAISIQAYQDAQAFFEAYEDLLQEACCKMLELDTDSLEIHYPQNEDGTYSAEVWARAKKGKDYEKTTIREYFDILSIPVRESRATLPIFKMVRYGDVIDVKLWDYYNVVDFLRVNEHGFYYLSCDCCENEELEKSLEKHMPEYWDYCLSVHDLFEYERVSDHFVYYHWLG